MSQLPGLFKVQASYKPTAEIDTFVGEQGELFYSEGDPRLRISDGVSPGGIVISSNSIGNIEGLTSDGSSLILTMDEGYDLIPETDSQQSLGASDKRWKDIYVSGGTIFIGENLQISENPETGTLELPAGTIMTKPDGTRSAVATVDTDSIDWNSVLSGLDLGLEYATTAYVDGKTRVLANKTYVDDTVQTAIDGISLDQAVRLLTELEDVDAQNLLDKAYLQYNPQTSKWEANTSLHYDVIALTTDVQDLQNNFQADVREIVSDLSLSDLGDVQSGRPASGSLLQYNGEVQEWQATNNIETTFGSLRLNGGVF